MTHPGEIGGARQAGDCGVEIAIAFAVFDKNAVFCPEGDFAAGQKMIMDHRFGKVALVAGFPPDAIGIIRLGLLELAGFFAYMAVRRGLEGREKE